MYATLNVKTGIVDGNTALKDTSAEFIAFLSGWSEEEWAREIS